MDNGCEDHQTGRPGLCVAVWLRVEVCGGRTLTAVYRLYARSVCDTKATQRYISVMCLCLCLSPNTNVQ